MKVIERPGIDPQWGKSWNSILRNRKNSGDDFYQVNLHALEQYIVHGKLHLQNSSSTVVPPIKPWERLAASISNYAFQSLMDFEAMGMARGGEFNVSLARRAFDAHYLVEHVALYRQHMRFERFGGPGGPGMQVDAIPFTALGLVVGQQERATRLAHVQLSVYRKNWYYYYFRDRYPIFHFIFRLLADYLEEPSHVLEGEPLTELIFNALFNNWRTADLELLGSICLAACDFHTSRCKTDNARQMYEFNNRQWTRIPIEILLLFKLRLWLGLENPNVDHPLMNTPLGKLPEKTDVPPDDLLTRVRARMMQDGYDEDWIYAQICKG